MSVLSRLFGRKEPPAPDATPAAPGTAADTGGAQPARAAVEAARALERERLAAALAAGDEATLGQLVLEGGSAQVRQQAAEAVHDPERIRALLRELRGRGDKGAFRILSARRDAWLAEARRAAGQLAERDSVAAALERHAQRPWDTVYVAQLEQLEKRWADINAGAEPQLADRVQAAIGRAEQVIEQHERAVVVAEAEALAAAHAAQAAQAARERLDTGRQDAAALEAERSRQEAAARAVAQTQEREDAAALESVTAATYRALAAMNRGHTARAARLREEIARLLVAVPAPPPRLLRQLAKLDAQLAEVRDWKNWSVSPKRTELMEQMERLIGAEIEPQALARRIRQLQESWRTLERGAGGEAAADAEAGRERFRELARRAWEPCARHFEAESTRKAANLERRQGLLQDLEAYAAALDPDPSAPFDFRELLKTLAQVRSAWRSCVPVDHRTAEPQQSRYIELTRALQARLDGEYERNVRARRELIERAAALASEPDTRRAVVEVKALNERWRGLGPVPREQGDALWHAFREPCDAVFARREQESKAYAAELEVQRVRAEDLCAELEGLAGAAAHEETAGQQPRERVVQLREEFDRLELPRAEAMRLRRRFQDAGRKLDARLALRAREQEHAAITALLDAADQIRRCTLLQAAGEKGTAEALAAAARAALAAARGGPPAARPLLESRLQQALSGSGAFDERAAALEELCLRAEIMAELPSPPDSQAARRDYQLKRLVRVMGGQASAGEDAPGASDLEGLVLEWLAAPATGGERYAVLRARFERCREHLRTRDVG